MNRVKQSLAYRSSGQRPYPNQQTETAHSHEGCACALEEYEEKACDAKQPRLADHLALWKSFNGGIVFKQIRSVRNAIYFAGFSAKNLYSKEFDFCKLHFAYPCVLTTIDAQLTRELTDALKSTCCAELALSLT